MPALNNASRSKSALAYNWHNVKLSVTSGPIQSIPHISRPVLLSKFKANINSKFHLNFDILPCQIFFSLLTEAFNVRFSIHPWSPQNLITTDIWKLRVLPKTYRDSFCPSRTWCIVGNVARSKPRAMKVISVLSRGGSPSCGSPHVVRYWMSARVSDEYIIMIIS